MPSVLYSALYWIAAALVAMVLVKGALNSEATGLLLWCDIGWRVAFVGALVGAWFWWFGK